MSSPAGRPLGLPAGAALPAQHRGRLRRARILEAAARLVDAATTADGRSITLRDLADAAEVPVASIYHYFPDVDSVIATVAADYGAELASHIEAALRTDADSAQNLLQVMVETYRAFFAARPGLRELWFDRRASEQVVAIHRDYRARMAVMLRDRMRTFLPVPPDTATYTMLFEMVGSLWEMAFDLDPAGAPRVVEEACELAHRFLHRRLGDTATPPRPGVRRTPPTLEPAAVDIPPRPWLPILPPQERGRRRRADILAAASSLIDREGPRGSSVTLRGITDEAGCSPASVYRYFRDVESLMAAVADAYMDGLLAVTGDVPDGKTALEREVLAQRDYFRNHPGLRLLWFDRRSSPAIQDMHAYYRRVRADRLQRRIMRSGLSPRHPIELEMHIATTGALWELAFTSDPDGHPDVLAEIVELGRELTGPTELS